MYSITKIYNLQPNSSYMKRKKTFWSIISLIRITGTKKGIIKQKPQTFNLIKLEILHIQCYSRPSQNTSFFSTSNHYTYPISPKLLPISFKFNFFTLILFFPTSFSISSTDPSPFISFSFFCG